MIRDILCAVFKLDKKEDYDLILKDRNSLWDEAHALKTQKLHLIDKIGYEEQALIKSFMPVLAERGRRVFGNLKQSQPRTVHCFSGDIAEGKILVEPATGGGCFGSAYVVDTQLDLQCLYLALAGEKARNWKTSPSVYINGFTVICESQIFKEERENG